MTRFFKLLVAACLMLTAAESAGARPNIIFILTDDLGVNDLACYGRKDHQTPNLDRLAREGARFTSAYCAQPICSPSRAAILTGKAPARLHLTTYLPGRANASSQRLLHPEIRQHLPLEEKSIAEVLKGKGYKSGYVGKWHLGGKGFLPPDQGFDYFHPGKANTTPSETEGGKGEYDLTEKAIEFMTQHREEPFFLYLSHNSPHIPYTARPGLVAKHKDAFEPAYAAMIETLDDSVGRLLKSINELGLRENTLVIFTSDNGGLHVPELNHRRITHNTPFRAGKGFVNEGGLRIPLIARWPGKVPAEQTIDTPVVNTDWLPTFMDIAGLPPADDLDGASIVPILMGKDKTSSRQFFWHFPHYNNQGGRPAGAVREGDWKMIEHYDSGPVELYNLKSDIGESRNLAASEPDRAKRLQSALADWRKEIRAQTNPPNPSYQAEDSKPIYHAFDASRFDPLTATPSEWEAVQQWRSHMDAAVRRDK